MICLFSSRCVLVLLCAVVYVWLRALVVWCMVNSVVDFSSLCFSFTILGCMLLLVCV